MLNVKYLDLKAEKEIAGDFTRILAENQMRLVTIALWQSPFTDLGNYVMVRINPLEYLEVYLKQRIEHFS